MNTFAMIGTFAAIVTLQAASAGSPIHRMPANDVQAQPSYQLKLNAPAVTGAPLEIALINAADGQVVPGSQISVTHAVFQGPKAVPMFRSVPMMLTRKGDGSFVCGGEHHVAGERLTLRGAGPGDAAPVWLTVAVKG